jgi:hypothetical protein
LYYFGHARDRRVDAAPRFIPLDTEQKAALFALVLPARDQVPNFAGRPPPDGLLARVSLWRASEVRRWRHAALPRGKEVVDWMLAHQGPVRLNDDDAAAVAEYVRALVASAEPSD